MTRHERRAVACHEAGHVVMAVWYGLHVRDVTLRRSGEALGMVHAIPADDFGTSFCHRLIVNLSGLVAEAELTGKVRKEWWSLGAGRDIENVIALVRPLIRKNWLAIQAVAEALVVKKTLSGRQVEDLVRLAGSVTRLKGETGLLLSQTDRPR